MRRTLEQGLSPIARRMIDRALPGEAPRVADRERVRAAFQIKIAAASAAPVGDVVRGDVVGGDVAKEASIGTPMQSLSTGGATTALRWWVVLGVACGAGALVWSALGDPSERTRVEPPPVVVESSPAATPIATEASEPSTSPPPSSPTLPSPPPMPAASPTGSLTAKPSGGLADELALLDRAQRALASGDAAGALAAIETHRQRHPAGQLAEEREGAGVLALCAAGARQPAIEAARRFSARWPSSPLGPRIRASCAGDND